MLQEKLTKRQRAIFDFIRNTIESSGFGPTIREIADETIELDELRDSLVKGLQKVAEIDEPEDEQNEYR